MYTSPTCDSVTPAVNPNPALPKALQGLLDQPRTLPPQLFYDARGAKLFEAITRLDEYYLTRTERAILTTYASEIATVLRQRAEFAAGKETLLIEYGSGAAEKVRLLLDAIEPTIYVPVDVSKDQLLGVADQLASDYPEMAVRPVVADFTSTFVLPEDLPVAHRIALFLGSTIGNFHPHESRTFLQRVAQQLGPNGMLLLGVDLRKAPSVLHAAYNDRLGITAEFNRNILRHIKRDYQVGVVPDHFEHYAFYNPVAGRMEMHLIASQPTELVFGGHRLHFAPGEGIWTESSYKYTLQELRNLVQKSGFDLVQVWTDPAQWFAVAALRRLP